MRAVSLEQRCEFRFVIAQQIRGAVAVCFAENRVRITYGALEIKDRDAESGAFKNSGQIREAAHLAYVLPSRGCLLLMGLG